jgi:hypothetical protein
MIFGKHRNKDINIFINNKKLEIVQTTKFLVLTLDSQFSWKPHIGQTTKKVAKMIGILTRTKQFLIKMTLIQLYFSFAYPYLIYGNIIWGFVPANTLWPLFKIQKVIIRIIGNIKRRNSTLLEFKKLKIVRLPDIFQFSTFIYV